MAKTESLENDIVGGKGNEKSRFSFSFGSARPDWVSARLSPIRVSRDFTRRSGQNSFAEKGEQAFIGAKFRPAQGSICSVSSLRFSSKFDRYTIQQARVWQGKREARVATAYKRAAKKVKPVDTDQTDGSIPGGILNWKDKALEKEKGLPKNDKFPDYLIPKFSAIPRGSRLTPERMKKLIIGDGLLPRERELFEEMLYCREAVMAWEFHEMGKVSRDVSPPVKINAIPHKAWQTPSFAIPRALHATVTEMLQERLDRGVLEPCHGPYRNPWFLVEKKEKGRYRIINAALDMNRVTIRDANLPPSADEFSEEFAGCQIASLIDFFAGYDQMELDVQSRDMTAFMTPLGLLRMTTPPMGATNSVAQFVRVMTKILLDHIRSGRAKPFLDDIAVKGPKDNYNNEEVETGIRRFVLEHIMWLDAVLADIERAGCSISGIKSQFCMPGLKIVGYVTDSEGRHPDVAKVIKIIDWPEPTDATNARAFIGLCVYYRIWVEGFAIVAEPIYRLLKKDVEFRWGDEQTLSMDKLKMALTAAPALITIDYSEGAGAIILAVDASLLGWGAVLMQVVLKKRHPARYESGMWNPAEQRYDATKRECRGVLKALKKFRHWLYGVHFILETDANVLVAQLNGAASDLPGSLVMRWLAWIRLFDFEVKHVAGKKHTAADGLSRRPATKQELKEQANEVDIDDFIDVELNALRIAPVSAEVKRILAPEYSDKMESFATYLTTMRRPAEMTAKEARQFKQEALRFRVEGDQLYRRGSKNVPARRVIDDEESRQRILKDLHDNGGHRGREGTYRRVADRYWWENLARDVKNYVRTCEACQKRDPTRLEEALHPTWVNGMWQKVGLDVVHMPACRGMKYLVIARDDFSGWPEAKALHSATAKNVAKFLWEDVICRHGCFGKLIVDGGPENKDQVIELANRYAIKRVVVSAYHPQANGMVERGHKPIVDALSKMTNGGLLKWVDNLHAVLWADRTTVKKSTGHTPFYLNHGCEPMLPIELEIPTWNVLPWYEVRSTAELLSLRARQIQRRDEDIEEAALYLQRKRMEGKDNFDLDHRIREKDFSVNDMVLLHDTKRENIHTGKLEFRWLGPYLIHEVIPDKGTYRLKELDGSQFAGTVAGNRLKAFNPRETPVNFNNNNDTNDDNLETEKDINSNSQGSTARRGGDDHDHDPTDNNQQALIPHGWPMAVIIPRRRASPMETEE